MENIDSTPITSQQRDILRHSVAADAEKPGYRNYFCANIGSDDHAACVALEDMGLMEAGVRINCGKDQYFFVTRKGCEAIGLSERATNAALKD